MAVPYTLLDMVQQILMSMDSDTVNDISDTEESLQVANFIKQTYIDLFSTLDMPAHYDFFELEASGDATKPTLMYLPVEVSSVSYIKYDVRDDGATAREMRTIEQIDLESFIDRMNGYDTADTEIFSFNYVRGAETFDVRGRNDLQPTTYAHINNTTLLFDSYDSTVDTTLQANKTTCYGLLQPTDFSLTNTFTPDIDARQFSLLFNEAKSQCFAEIKQTTNSVADRRARRALVSARRTGERTPGKRALDRAPDYGRK